MGGGGFQHVNIYFQPKGKSDISRMKPDPDKHAKNSCAVPRDDKISENDSRAWIDHNAKHQNLYI